MVCAICEICGRHGFDHHTVHGYAQFVARPKQPKTPLNGLRGFFGGATYPARGALFLARHPKIWMYAAAPTVVYLTMLLALLVVGMVFVGDVYRWVQPESLARPAGQTGWFTATERGVLKGLLGFAAFLIVATGAMLLTLLTAAVLAGPFNEKLSEVVERLATGRPPPDEPFRWKALVTDSVRSVMSSLQLLGIFGVLYIPLLLLSLVPVIGLAGVAGTFLYGCFFLALNFLDPALDRRRLTLRHKVRWVRAVLATHMGFGMVLFGLMLVPILNLVIPPCFVVAGTLLWVDRERIQPSLPTAAPPVVSDLEETS